MKKTLFLYTTVMIILCVFYWFLFKDKVYSVPTGKTQEEVINIINTSVSNQKFKIMDESDGLCKNDLQKKCKKIAIAFDNDTGFIPLDYWFDAPIDATATQIADLAQKEAKRLEKQWEDDLDEQARANIEIKEANSLLK